MAQSAKFGFGHQKEKKNLASLWSSAAFNREHGKKSSPKPSGVCRRGKPQFVHLHLHHSPKKSRQTVLLPGRLPARDAEHPSALPLSVGSPGRAGS